MLRFMIKLPFRIIAAPVWLVLAAVNIVLVFLVGLSAGFCYLIAGISVVTECYSAFYLLPKSFYSRQIQ